VKGAFDFEHDVRGRWISNGVKDRVDRESRMADIRILDPISSVSMRFERQANLMEKYKAFDLPKAEKVFYWDLPGHGLSYGDCGSILHKGCNNIDGHSHRKTFVRVFKKNCRRKQCPVCFQGWAASEGERALIRLAAASVGFDVVAACILNVKKVFSVSPRAVFHKALVSDLEDLIHQSRKKVVHYVLSPPDGTIKDSAESFVRGRALAYKIAKKSGIRGGSVIVHPYRLKCVKCGSAIPDFDKVCPKCGGSAFSWFFSFHFHVVGFGWLEDIAEGYARHGWVVRNLGVRKSVFWTVQYLLSHAGVSNRFHTVTWFGSMAYNVMRAVPVLGIVQELCPYCVRVLRPMLWIGGLDRPPPLAVLSETDPYLNEFLADPLDWKGV